MGINFPSSPAVGTLHPDPAQAGIPQYKWDGTTWVAVAAPEALTYVKRGGDVMTGLLTLSGDPVAALDAVPKRWAAPLDALSYNGMQVNGSMEVSQENGGTTSSASNATRNILDGWFLYSLGSQVMAGLQATGVSLPGFENCLEAYPTTGSSSPAATDAVFLGHKIEGYRIRRLAFGTASASPITLSFWVQAGRTGMHSGSVQNSPATHSYIFTYQINSVNVWEYKTITIPGSTAGTWAAGSTAGMQINFAMLGGSSVLAAPGSWLSGNYFGATGTTNECRTVGDKLIITGVTVLPGIYAPTAAQSPLIMRPFDQELATCQRYFYKRYFGAGSWFATLMAYAANAASGPVYTFPVTMRIAPTFTANGSTFCLSSAAGAQLAMTGGSMVTTADGCYINGASTSSGGLVAGNATLYGASSASWHQFDARL